MKILQLALRSVTRFRLYTSVNIIGLALSLACVIIISRYVYSELMTDHLYPELERLYTTTCEEDNRPGIIRYQGVSNPNNEKAFRSILEHPGVECATSLRKTDEISCWYKEKEYPNQTLIADSNFFKIAKYPLIVGVNDLTKPEDAVITAKFAHKIFGDETALGKQLQLSMGKTVTITGVIGEPTTASSIEFDIVISEQLSQMWGRMGNHLVRLHPNADYRQINEQYSKFMRMEAWEYSIRYQLYPLSDVYFSKSIDNYFFRIGNFTYIWILSLVAFMILLVGIFNFVNIYSVVVLRRGREFGMKKVFGAGAKMMFGQLYAENILMTGSAILLGWIIIETTNQLVQNELGIIPVANVAFDLLLTGGILLILPLFTALIPFIRYNYSSPITSLRSVNQSGGSIVSRKLFLVTQYIITFTLVISSLFFIKQLRFMLDTDPGINIKDIIEVQFLKYETTYDRMTKEEWEKNREKENRIVDVIKQRMDASPLFEHWTHGNSPIGKGNKGTKFKDPSGEYKELSVLFVSPAWMQLFGIETTEGQPIDPKESPERSYNLYLSESGKKLLGITDINTAEVQPESRLWFFYNDDMSKNPPYHILGTIKDFNVGHLADKAYPMVLLPGSTWYKEPILVSIVPGRRQEAIQFLKELHDELIGGSFEYSFIEDQHKALYQKDLHITLVYSIFAFIAILISSLGLFSLSLFDVQQRFREIAIRKVNGANTWVILRMLLVKYFKLLGISFLIALPISWLAINRYLEDFANKTPISWWIFAIALILTAGISLLTLIWQTGKAARTNPAKAIKTE